MFLLSGAFFRLIGANLQIPSPEIHRRAHSPLNRKVEHDVRSGELLVRRGEGIQLVLGRALVLHDHLYNDKHEKRTK